MEFGSPEIGGVVEAGRRSENEASVCGIPVRENFAAEERYVVVCGIGHVCFLFSLGFEEMGCMDRQ
jgi:hypothetical protein